MATVTTTHTPEIEIDLWVNPSNIGGNQSGIPMGRIRYQGAFTVPAKALNDTSQVIIDVNLPANNVYRSEAFFLAAAGTTNAPLADFNPSWLGRLLTNDSGSFTQFVCTNNVLEGTAGNNEWVFTFMDNAIGQYQISWTPTQDLSRLLFTSLEGTAGMNLGWTDGTTTTTDAVTVYYHFTFLQYSVDAARGWALNTPQLINGA